MTIDANIIIAYLAGEKEVVQTIQDWKKEGRILFLSTVAETEILSFSHWTNQEEKWTIKFLEENFTSVLFDRSIARLAAQIRRKSKLKLPDAAIAATALFTRTPVVSRNQRDFKKIPGLKIVVV